MGDCTATANVVVVDRGRERLRVGRARRRPSGTSTTSRPRFAKYVRTVSRYSGWMPAESTARVCPRDEPLGHEQRLDERRRALVERRVGDVEPGQQADVRLELEDRLERALRDLGLIRRVGRQPLGAVEHLVGDRRDVVVVDAGAQEERGVARVRRCAAREPAEEPADLDLGHRRRQVRRAARTDAGTEANRSSIERTPIAASIARPLGVGGREKLHFSCSSSRHVLGVGLGRHELADLLVGRDLELDEPAVAERIVVDDAGLGDRGLVDLDDLARDRR